MTDLVLDKNNTPFKDEGDTINLYSPSLTRIATGYVRVVRGGRGNYIEISPSQILRDNLIIPPDQRWRLNHHQCYYLWYASNDKSLVKVYDQLRRVNYADYRIGMLYVAPKDVIINAKTI